MHDEEEVVPSDTFNEQLLCPFSESRLCGGDCVAYRTIPDENKRIDRPAASCIIISSVERAGSGAQSIAGTLQQLLVLLRTQNADTVRKQHMPTAPTRL